MTSQFFQPLAPPTLGLMAEAIDCVLSEYASWMKATVMFSQDDDWVIFCTSPMINITLEASSLINHTIVGYLVPPPARNSDRIGAPQPTFKLFNVTGHSIPTLSPLLQLNWHLWLNSVWICTPRLHMLLNTLMSPLISWDGTSSIPTGTSQSGSLLLYVILCLMPPFSALLHSDRHSSIPVGVPLAE